MIYMLKELHFSKKDLTLRKINSYADGNKKD